MPGIGRKEREALEMPFRKGWTGLGPQTREFEEAHDHT